MKGVKDLYTRNYRIQRGERADVPHADSSAPIASDDLTPKSENGVFEPVLSPEEDHILSEPTSCETEETASALPEETADKRESSEPQNSAETIKPQIKKLRAVKSFRVRSADFFPSPQETREDTDAEASEPCSLSENEEIDVTPAAIFEERKEESQEERRDERREPGFETPYDKPRREPDRHFDKPMGKKSFGLPSLSLKGFSNEDIFLCAIMLLLINEGCEDIMILILGFLLIS